MLFTLLAFAVALGVLITFHELGHYWVAKRCGVKVLRFSVGFGKVLLRRTDRSGTEWALSAIPLGGYVKMLDEPPADATASEEKAAFNRLPVGKRIAVMVAGPFANLLLAAVLYALLNLAGTVQPQAIVAAPAAGTPAAVAGFKQGDRIVAIDHHVVKSWGDVRRFLLDGLTAGGRVPVVVDTGGSAMREYTLELPAARLVTEKTDLLAKAGLRLAHGTPKIEQVTSGGAGAKAGLQKGDLIVAVGADENPDIDAVVDDIQKSPGRPVFLGIVRNGQPQKVTVIPRKTATEKGPAVGRIGAMLGVDFPMTTVRYGVVDSVVNGVGRAAQTTWLSLKMMGRMLTGGVSLRTISGPVTIADYAGQTARIGWAAYISFLALISVSIGVLNLLPIPMLDGGHIMYCLFEAARGRPLPEHWRLRGQQLGLALLLMLMLLAFFNDFSRLFS
jgi:regulator of sigma E protease